MLPCHLHPHIGIQWYTRYGFLSLRKTDTKIHVCCDCFAASTPYVGMHVLVLIYSALVKHYPITLKLQQLNSFK